eukprot:COSAG01_NODE_66215_length_271_cov_0.377907_1_plen_33_part_10
MHTHSLAVSKLRECPPGRYNLKSSRTHIPPSRH